MIWNKIFKDGSIFTGAALFLSRVKTAGLGRHFRATRECQTSCFCAVEKYEKKWRRANGKEKKMIPFLCRLWNLNR